MFTARAAGASGCGREWPKDQRSCIHHQHLLQRHLLQLLQGILWAAWLCPHLLGFEEKWKLQLAQSPRGWTEVCSQQSSRRVWVWTRMAKRSAKLHPHQHLLQQHLLQRHLQQLPLQLLREYCGGLAVCQHTPWLRGEMRAPAGTKDMGAGQEVCSQQSSRHVWVWTRMAKISGYDLTSTCCSSTCCSSSKDIVKAAWLCIGTSFGEMELAMQKIWGLDRVFPGRQQASGVVENGQKIGSCSPTSTCCDRHLLQRHLLQLLQGMCGGLAVSAPPWLPRRNGLQPAQKIWGAGRVCSQQSSRRVWVWTRMAKDRQRHKPHQHLLKRHLLQRHLLQRHLLQLLQRILWAAWLCAQHLLGFEEKWKLQPAQKIWGLDRGVFTAEQQARLGVDENGQIGEAAATHQHLQRHHAAAAPAAAPRGVCRRLGCVNTSLARGEMEAPAGTRYGGLDKRCVHSRAAGASGCGREWPKDRRSCIFTSTCCSSTCCSSSREYCRRLGCVSTSLASREKWRLQPCRYGGLDKGVLQQSSRRVWVWTRMAKMQWLRTPPAPAARAPAAAPQGARRLGCVHTSLASRRNGSSSWHKRYGGAGQEVCSQQRQQARLGVDENGQGVGKSSNVWSS